MKATMTDQGVLIVTPETPLETFALTKWAEIALAGQYTPAEATETFTLLRGAKFIAGLPPAA